MVKNTILFIAATVVGLLLCEGLLQIVDVPADDFSPWISDEVTGFRFASGLRQRMVSEEFDVEIRTNEHGFRDDPIGEKRGFRILLLGDSFAFGYGVDREAGFADLLERRLGVDLINASVGGFEIIHQLRWYRASGKAFAADLVIYALYLGNDLSRNEEWQARPDGKLVNPKQPYPVRAAGTLKLAALVRNLVYRKRQAALRGNEWMPYPDYLTMALRQPSPQTRQRYSAVRRLLEELRTEVTAGGAELFVVPLPYKTLVDPAAQARLRSRIPGFEGLFDLGKPPAEVGAILEEIGIEHTDLTPAMRKYCEEDSNVPLFFFSDGHLTPAGHAFVAARLEPILAELIERSAGRQRRRPS